MSGVIRRTAGGGMSCGVFFAGGSRRGLVCERAFFCRGLTPPPAPRRRPGPHLVLGVFGVWAVVVVRLMWRNAATRFRLFWRKRVLSCATSCHPGEHAPGPPDGGPPPRLCYRAAPLSRLDRGAVRLRSFARGCEASAAERAILQKVAFWRRLSRQNPFGASGTFGRPWLCDTPVLAPCGAPRFVS